MVSAPRFVVFDFRSCCFIFLASFGIFTAVPMALSQNSDSMSASLLIRPDWEPLWAILYSNQVLSSPANLDSWSYSLVNPSSALWGSTISAYFAYQSEHSDQVRTSIAMATKRNYPARPDHSVECHPYLAIQHSHSFDSILNLVFAGFLHENI